MKKQVKDKRITILKVFIGVDDIGDPIEEIRELYNLWAYYRYASGDEKYMAHQMQSEIEAIFIINWVQEIDTSMILRYEGQDYNITSIDDFEGGKKDLKLTVKKVGR